MNSAVRKNRVVLGAYSGMQNKVDGGGINIKCRVVKDSMSKSSKKGPSFM